jgi:hypothetical protein
MTNKYIELKQEDALKEKDAKKQQAEKISLMKIAYFLFFPLLFTIFLIFTLVSLIIMRPGNKSYYQTQNAINLLKNNAGINDFKKKGFLTVNEYVDMSKRMFSPFIRYGEASLNSKLWETIYMVSTLRLGFVRLN